MLQTKHSGLAGKARRQHRNSRATRLADLQEIDDFLEPIKDHRPPVMIGRRAEFLPTAELASERKPSSPETQLELPLDGSVGDTCPPHPLAASIIVTRSEPIHYAPRSAGKIPHAVADSLSHESVGKSVAGTLIRSPFPNGPPGAKKRPSPIDQGFRLSRFLGGCAIGGAVGLILFWIASALLG